MDRIRIALVGCGGMGTRHLYGLAELTKTPFANVELAAVCDIRPENGELAAGEAEKLLGSRPQVFTDLERMAREVPDLHAVDVVVDPGDHHTVACQALDLGLHVMVEKPLAITVRGCHRIIEAARRNNRILSVAENFRRDPSARLVRHLLDSGAIGRPVHGHLPRPLAGAATSSSPRGGTTGTVAACSSTWPCTSPTWSATSWATSRRSTDRSAWPCRCAPGPGAATAPTSSTAGAWRRWRRRCMPRPRTAPWRPCAWPAEPWSAGSSASAATEGCSGEAILGDRGALKGFGSRGGRAVLQAAGEEEKGHEQLVAEAADFELEPLAAHFFPDGVATADVDWKLLALEYYELGEAILHGRAIEVDGTEGMKAVAAVYAIFESSRLGRAVSMSEVESAEVYGYQAGIDAALNL